MYSILNTGGYLELSTSNTYIFDDTQTNDILLYTDTPSQNILLGTSGGQYEQSTIKISSNLVNINKNFNVLHNFSVGTSNQVNKFTLVGSNRNILDGPSIICIGQNDNYPLYQQLNMDHDDIATGYDNYFDGSNYIASSSNASYQIRKNINKLMIQSCINTAPGTVIDSSFEPAITIESNSFVGVGMCNPTNRFTISGDAGSINGPHLKGFVGSDSENSVWQQLNWDKDSISTGYDMYFDGNNWISSQSNANFLLQKSGGKLAWYSSYNVGEGCNITNNLSISLSINSNQLIGIGTSNNTHRLTISGPSNSLLGPHMAMFTDDDIIFPVYQQVISGHDNILQNYDAYWDGSNIISSSSNSSFVIEKNANKLTILSCYNTSSGSIIDNNLYPALTINSNSYIGLGSRYPKNRLTLQGLSNNISGPHILAYTDDNSNYPLFQQYNSRNDDITTGYDVFWDGSNWISSFSNGVFQIKKNDGKLIIQSSENNVLGSIVDDYFNPALTINNNSFVSIGNSNPTHRLTISGTSNDDKGPHIAFYTDDDSNYPLYQQYNVEHDNINQSYDQFYDGSNWISCHNFGNFRISKSNHQLIVFSSCNINTGTVISTNNPSLVINNDGLLGIGTSNCSFKISISGSSNSVKGPHITCYTDDDVNYPLFQQTNIEHGLISTNYDLFWDGSNYISSSYIANYQIIKMGDSFSFRVAKNVLPGNQLDSSLCNALTISKNGYVNLGGSNPQYRFTMIGLSNDISGPHTAFYVNYDSNNPLYFQYNSDHDDIHTGYDTYYDGSNWLSCSSNGNFLQSKSSSSLTYYYANSVITNREITWQPSFTIANDGLIGIRNINPQYSLTIKGLENSILGPHIVAYTMDDDINPLWCQINIDHNNINTGYDTYWNGSNWINSSSNGSFLMMKSQDRLIICSSSNQVPGTKNQWFPNITIHDNGFVGFGTENPLNRLTINGPQSSINGPHLVFYVDEDSNYPIYQQLNNYHDDICFNFDQYWDGSNIISSSINGNYQIIKSDRLFSMFVSDNNFPGCNIESSNLAYSVNSCGNFGINTSNQTFNLEVAGQFMINTNCNLGLSNPNFDLMSLQMIDGLTIPPPSMRDIFTYSESGIYNISGISNLSGQYIISSSSSLENAFGPYNIWDNDILATYWQSDQFYSNNIYIGNNSTLVNGSNYFGEWIEITLPYNLNLTQYKLQSFQGGSSNNSISSFFIVGSYDKTNWDQIDYQSNLDRWTSIATSNSTNINFTPSNNCYSYPNFRVVIQDCINTESPVINYMSLNGNIELYNTRSRIITNDNTMVFGSSNNKITMSNGNLLISSNLYQYGQSFFHDIVTINSNLNPRSNQLYDIGNENMRWNNIFLSSNGININDLVLNKDSSGALAVLSAVTNIPQRIVVDEILLGNQHDAVNSNVYLLTASSNGLGITPQNNVTSQNYIQFNDLYLTPINIGIGTSNPQESFDISYGNLLARNNAYVLSNFGLGTLSPSEKMDIRGGNVKISSNLYVLDNLGIGTSNISETFVLGNGNAKIASNLYVLENIGIGLSNPSENLEVINNTKIDNNCYIQGYTSIGPGFSNPTESLDVIDNVKVGKNLYVLNSIGVGTSNPLVNSPGLHVECDIRADSNIYGFSNLIIANNASFGDYIIRTFPRILNVTNLAYQNICVIGVTSSNDNPYFNNTYYVDWTLTQGQTSNYIVKTYSFAITGNQTSNNYLRVLPNYNGGLTQCNDFDLEVLTTPSNTTSFRLVRTSTSSSCSSNNITCLLKLTRPDLSFLQVNDDLNSNLSAVNKGTFTGNMLTLNQRTGNVGIYSSNPQVTFEINGTDAILIPSGTLLQRPNIPVTGHVRYNTSTSQFEGFGPANSWGSLGGVKSVDQLTYIAAENFPGSGDANLRFITSNIERMRIDCNGIIDMWSNVYVGGNTQINGNCALSGIDFADGLYTNQYNPSITVNMSGLAYSGSNSGLLIEEAGSVTGYITSTSDRYGFQFKPPGGTIFQIYSSNNMVNLQNNTLIMYNGYVGINKIPNYSLDVFGTINATQILVNGNPISSASGSNGSGFWTSVYSNVVTNCNVGIGLSNPTALLHVNGGNTILGCNVSIGCNLGIFGNISCLGSLSNTGNVSLNNITSINTLIIQSSSCNLGSSYIIGNQTINGNLLSSGSCYVSNNIITSNNLTVNCNLIAIGSFTNCNNFNNLGDLIVESNAFLNDVSINGLLQQNFIANFASDTVTSGNIYSLGNIINSNYLSNLDNSSFSSNVIINSNLYVGQNIFTSNSLSNLGNCYLASNTIVSNITILGTQTLLGSTALGSNINFTVSSNLIVAQNIFSSNSFSNFGPASFSSNLTVMQSFCNFGSGYFSNGVNINGLCNLGKSFFQDTVLFSNIITNTGGAYFRSNVTVQNITVINDTSFAGNLLVNSFSNLGNMVNLGNFTTSTISNLSNMIVNNTIYSSNLINSNNIIVGKNITSYTISNISDQFIGGNTTSSNIISLYNGYFGNGVFSKNITTTSNISTSNFSSSGNSILSNLSVITTCNYQNSIVLGNFTSQTSCNLAGATYCSNVSIEGILINMGNIIANSNFNVQGTQSNFGNVFFNNNLIVNNSQSNLGNVSISSNNIIWGNLGLGTASPLSKINIVNPGNKKMQFDNDITTRRHIVLYETNNNESQYCGFGMTSNSICYQVDSNNRDHAFYSGSSNQINNELMRITGFGYVGINTSSPSEILDVSGNIKTHGNLYVLQTLGINNSNPSAPLTIGNNTNSNSWLQILASNNCETRLISSNDSQTYLQHTGNFIINSINNNNYTHIFISSNGHIGISNNLPQYGLDVAPQSKINNLIIWSTSNDMTLFNSAFSNSYTSNYALYQGIQGDTVLNSSSNQPLIFKNNNYETLRINSNNFVGINNSNPNYLLDVNGIINSSNGYKMPINGNILTGRISQLQNDAGYITQGIGSNGTYFYNTVNIISSGPAITISNQNPGDMLVTNYTANNDRYGIGQYSNGILRVFASGSNPNASVNLSVPLSGQTSNALFYDYLTMTTNTGYIGINTSSPMYQLDVNGDLRVQGNLILGETNKNIGELSSFNVGSTLLTSTYLNGLNSDFAINTVGNNTLSTNIYCTGLTNYIGINTSNPEYGLDVHANVMTGLGTSNCIARFLTTSPGVGCELLLAPNNNISKYFKIGTDQFYRFNIYNENNAGVYLSSGSTSWISNSDKNLKKNIVEIKNPLQKALNIKGYTYQWNHENNHERHHYGVVAQEVENVAPEIVTKNKDDKWGVSYTEIIPILLGAIQELKKDNDHLKNEILQIKKKIL